jgi:hypothetical protein
MEPHESGLIRRLRIGWKAAKFAEGQPVHQRILQLRVRQIVPEPKQERLEQTQRRIAPGAFGGAVDRGENGIGGPQVDQRVDFGQLIEAFSLPLFAAEQSVRQTQLTVISSRHVAIP